MLSESKCKEIREHLEKSQNPVFYYDNDADGLCSFLIFSRFLGRGKGIAVRSYPDLNVSYAQKARELGADAVFILDKPILDPEFLKALKELSLPVIWIDHHELQGKSFETDESFFSYNPIYGKPKSSEPVTYWTQKICRRKEDIWIAVMGCIADYYMPDFAEDFARQHPDLWGKNIIKPFDAYYRTEIGKLAQALNFGLKDSITNVVHLQHYLIKCTSPSEVLADVVGNAQFRNTYEKLNSKYNSLLEQALLCKQGSLVFFSYGGDTSMSSQLSNELVYRFSDCVIGVAYTNAGITNISLRGDNIRDMLARILPKLTNATGGGHPKAVGARIQSTELPKFRELLSEEVINGKS